MSVSAVRISLQPAHGFIPLVVIGAGLVGAWTGFKVCAARKKLSTPSLQLCAEKDANAKTFNSLECVHEKVKESLPLFYAVLATSSVYRPKLAAAAGVVRILSFIMDIKESSSGDPRKRSHVNNIGSLATVVMLGLSIETSLRILGYI